MGIENYSHNAQGIMGDFLKFINFSKHVVLMAITKKFDHFFSAYVLGQMQHEAAIPQLIEVISA